MIAKPTTRQAHEMIHWFWLWVLAAIAVSVLYGRVQGENARTLVRHQPQPQTSEYQPAEKSTSIPIEAIVDAVPIPIPNIDDPSLFRFPNRMANPNDVTMEDVLRLNQADDYQRAIKAWHNLRMKDDSVTWKQMGLGVAYLRLEQFDQALQHLTFAVERDPANAVAEYFLGRVRQEQGREVPFWFEMDDGVPFRLAAHNQDQTDKAGGDQAQTRGKSVLPPFRNPNFDQQAERHFRRAMELAPKCDLDRTINVVQPALQFANQWPIDRPTVRDLLISLGEANYVEKTRQALGEALTVDTSE